MRHDASRSVRIDPKFDTGSVQLSQRAIKAQDEVDRMSAAMRAVVHEFGYAAVNACIVAGVKSPGAVRQLILEIWAGARAPNQGARNGFNKAVDHLDWLLVQQLSPVRANTLLRILADNHQVLVPRHPTAAMIEASMDAVRPRDGIMSKRDKHSKRLSAAIGAHIDKVWPGIGA